MLSTDGTLISASAAPHCGASHSITVTWFISDSTPTHLLRFSRDQWYRKNKTDKTQSTTEDYIRADHKLHSISKLFISQVIIPQVLFFSLFIFRGHSTREPASRRVTYFILRAYTGTGVSHSQQTSSENLNLRCDVDLEHNNPNFTECDDAPSS